MIYNSLLSATKKDIALTPILYSQNADANTALFLDVRLSTITLYGLNFDTTPSNNTVVFSGGTGHVISATSTQLVVAIDTPFSGSPRSLLYATVTTLKGGKSNTTAQGVFGDLPTITYRANNVGGYNAYLSRVPSTRLDFYGTNLTGGESGSSGGGVYNNNYSVQLSSTSDGSQPFTAFYRDFQMSTFIGLFFTEEPPVGPLYARVSTRAGITSWVRVATIVYPTPTIIPVYNNFNALTNKHEYYTFAQYVDTQSNNLYWEGNSSETSLSFWGNNLSGVGSGNTLTFSNGAEGYALNIVDQYKTETRNLIRVVLTKAPNKSCAGLNNTYLTVTVTNKGGTSTPTIVGRFINSTPEPLRCMCTPTSVKLYKNNVYVGQGSFTNATAGTPVINEAYFTTPAIYVDGVAHTITMSFTKDSINPTISLVRTGLSSSQPVYDYGCNSIKFHTIDSTAYGGFLAKFEVTYGSQVERTR